MTNVEIRRATLDDAPAMAAIIREIGWFAAIKEETPESTQARVERHLRLCLADTSHSIYVAEKEAEVVGYAAAHWLPYLVLAGPEGYVSELFLRSAARGQGIGAALLETIRAEAEDRGCARLMLLNIRDRKSYQRGFYKKLGWQERELAANFVLPLK